MLCAGASSAIRLSATRLLGVLALLTVSLVPVVAQELNECFDYCHTWAMKYYLWGDEDGAAEHFEVCMETYCGGM